MAIPILKILRGFLSLLGNNEDSIQFEDYYKTLLPVVSIIDEKKVELKMELMLLSANYNNITINTFKKNKEEYEQFYRNSQYSYKEKRGNETLALNSNFKSYHLFWDSIRVKRSFKLCDTFILVNSIIYPKYSKTKEYYFTTIFREKPNSELLNYSDGLELIPNMINNSMQFSYDNKINEFNRKHYSYYIKIPLFKDSKYFRNQSFLRFNGEKVDGEKVDGEKVDGENHLTNKNSIIQLFNKRERFLKNASIKKYAELYTKKSKQKYLNFIKFKYLEGFDEYKKQELKKSIYIHYIINADPIFIVICSINNRIINKNNFSSFFLHYKKETNEYKFIDLPYGSYLEGLFKKNEILREGIINEINRFSFEDYYIKF